MILLLLILCVTMGAAAQNESSQKGYQSYVKGVLLFNNQDYVEAVKWFRKAAKQGHLEAQDNLGLCYRDGLGVAKDYVEAVKWFRKAAEQGNASAQYNLGACYENGYGVTQDDAEAERWYRKAAKQGHREAQEVLGER